ncbi:MAG: SDR family oxidoreductase [Anaerolineales bacterium]|nr:SDR family oxidoreductase [Anaerolineales bacterium]
MRLENKITFITGGGRGIGRALALGFAQAGAHVVLAARTQAEVETVAEEVQALGQRALPVVCDVANEEQVKAALQAALAEFGRLDVLVNNAGIGAMRPIHGTPLATWQKVLDVNLTGTFLCTKHAWKAMQTQGGGSIINIASLAGTRGVAMLTAYSASKWGQIGFTLSAAEEGKPHGIRVNAIAPGKGDTAIRAAVTEDKSKILKPEDHVGVGVFLASDESRYITGQVIEIDWFGE